jgi:bifunctional oligoribonuclease and PAP phosphatase NrnA
LLQCNVIFVAGEKGTKMELSPKQQAIEQIKKAKKILIIGHKKPDGDMIGSGLALLKAFSEMEKKAELVITEKIPETFTYLEGLGKVRPKLDYQEGKLIRIDTSKIPVKGLKYQKRENFLDIFLDADKNLKFEYLEIKNGADKPDLIVVLDTPDVEAIDAAYDETPELFYEVPIINIDHHAGNEYFGAVNLIDLTATSTSEILVSLLEALQYKIATPDIATALLTGIIADTQSFRSGNTTPKSLTVAAQLLAAGAKQQEIISNLYKKKPIALLRLWGEMLSGVQEDSNFELAWTKIDLTKGSNESLTSEDVLGSIDEIMANTPTVKYFLVLVQESENSVIGKIKARKGEDLSLLAQALHAKNENQAATFKFKGLGLLDAELKTLKILHDQWQGRGHNADKNIWEALEQKPQSLAKIPENKVQKKERPVIEEPPIDSVSAEDPIRKKATLTKKEDAIETALKSLSENQVEGKGFTPLKDIMVQKKKDLGMNSGTQDEIDVFDEESEE